MTDVELHEWVVEGHRQATRLAAALAHLTGTWDARKVWAANGSKSPVQRLARETRCHSGTAHREVQRARKLRSMPHADAAFAEGRVSVDQVDLLVRVNSDRVADQFAEAEQHLVESAERLAYKDLERVVRYWALHADSAAGDNARCRRDQRSAHCSTTFQGNVELRASLDPVDGDIVATELKRREQALFDADWATLRAEHGEHASADLLARTPAQRRADALVEMARRSAALPETAQPARPLISVVVDLGTVKRTICERADGTVLHPDSLLRLLDEADVERVVFDSPKRVLEVGERVRFFSAAQRRAVIVRDRRCQHPAGCDVPAEDCEIDHIVEWCDGGTTTIDNARAMCRVHNRRRPGRRSGAEDAGRRAPPGTAA